MTPNHAEKCGPRCWTVCSRFLQFCFLPFQTFFKYAKYHRRSPRSTETPGNEPGVKLPALPRGASWRRRVISSQNTKEEVLRDFPALFVRSGFRAFVIGVLIPNGEFCLQYSVFRFEADR